MTYTPPSPTCIRTALLLASLVFLSGCAWSQAPSLDDAISPPADVIDTASEEVGGQLALTQDGLWALVWKRERAREDIQQGHLLRVRGMEDSTFEGYFAVALQRNWGLLLQRIGGGSVPSELGDVDVTVITPEQLPEACAGDAADWPDKSCLSEAQAPAAWDIYALDGDRLASPPSPDNWRGELPYRRLAVATRTLLDPSAIETTPWRPRRAWLAVRREQTRPPNYDATLAADESCRPHESALDLAGLHTTYVELAPLKDALDVELAAIEHRSDALVRCDSKGDITFFTPVVFRPPLQIAYSSFDGVSLLGWRPVVVDGEDEEAVGLAARMMSAIASGRHDRADLFAGRLIERLPDKRSRRLALLSSPLAASAGLPEQAVRRMHYGAEKKWNPERNVAFQLARAWMWASFDQRRRALVEMKAVDELIARSRAPASTRRWRVWSELRSFMAAYSRRSSAEDGFRQGRAFFEDIPGAQSWREAVDWLRWSHLGGALPVVEGADSRFDLFRDAARGTSVACHDCRLDPYGLAFHAWNGDRASRDVDASLQELARLPIAAVRPGLTRAALTESAGREVPLALQMGVAALAPERAIETSITTAADAIGTTAQCKDGASTLGGRQTLARLLALRAEERGVPALEVAQWLVKQALDLACQDVSSLIDVVARRIDSNPSEADVLARFVTSVLSTASSQTLSAEDVSKMVEATRAAGLREACMLWTQAGSLAALQAGRVGLAEGFLIGSVDCHDARVADDLDATETYLSALIRYERTRRVPGHLPDDIARRLSIATRHRLDESDTCAGLASMEYWMSAGSSRRVARLAELIDIEAATDDMMLRTASRTASQASASYHAARRSLGEGRPALAADLLNHARRDFRAISHRPGLARTRVLIEAIYGDDFEAFLEEKAEATPADSFDDITDETTPAELLRGGRARVILQPDRTSESSPADRLAAALILGRDDTVSALVDEHSELAKGPFCTGTLR